jgi:hypothetical protein
MALEDAQNRLSSRPRLRALVGTRWLAEQSAKVGRERHELYDMLEIAADIPGVEALLDGLEMALGTQASGPMRKVAGRLVCSDSAD